MWTVGGDALNEATIITRLGYKVKLISCFGDDMIGSMLIEHCKKIILNTAHIQTGKEKVTGY